MSFALSVIPYLSLTLTIALFEKANGFSIFFIMSHNNVVLPGRQPPHMICYQHFHDNASQNKLIECL